MALGWGSQPTWLTDSCPLRIFPPKVVLLASFFRNGCSWVSMNLPTHILLITGECYKECWQLFFSFVWPKQLEWFCFIAGLLHRVGSIAHRDEHWNLNHVKNRGTGLCARPPFFSGTFLWKLISANVTEICVLSSGTAGFPGCRVFLLPFSSI